MIVNYDHCVHCDTKLNGFNKDHFVEVISDFSTMEKRYCCEKCFIKYYKFEGETNDFRKNNKTRIKNN